MKLIDIRILKVEFYPNKDYKETSGKETAGEVLFDPQIAVNHSFIDKTNDLVVIVGIRQKSGNVPYFFELHGGGHFKFDKTPEAKILKTFSTMNCPAIIFPYIRETIADLSRRAGFPALHLDPINFVEFAKGKEKAIKKKQATKTKHTSVKT